MNNKKIKKHVPTFITENQKKNELIKNNPCIALNRNRKITFIGLSHHQIQAHTFFSSITDPMHIQYTKKQLKKILNFKLRQCEEQLDENENEEKEEKVLSPLTIIEAHKKSHFSQTRPIRAIRQANKKNAQKQNFTTTPVEQFQQKQKKIQVLYRKSRYTHKVLPCRTNNQIGQGKSRNGENVGKLKDRDFEKSDSMGVRAWENYSSVDVSTVIV